MAVFPSELIAFSDDIAEALLPVKQALANFAKVLAAAFPAVSTLRFPRAHHPFEAKGAGPKHRVDPLKGGEEISAEVCQRLGVPRPARPWAAPPPAWQGDRPAADTCSPQTHHDPHHRHTAARRPGLLAWRRARNRLVLHPSPGRCCRRHLASRPPKP